MQTVSQEWKAAQEQTIVPESDVRVTLSVGDPEAQQDAQASTNVETDWSDAAGLTDGLDKDLIRYATGETNIWLLDGGSEILPDEAPYGALGYIGTALCGEDCVFTEIPTVTVSFSRVFDSILPGVTIVWAEAYGEWAARFRVRAFRGAVEVFSREVENHGDITSTVAGDITGYDRITVEVLEWSLPYRRARIERMVIGLEQAWNKKDLLSFSHSLYVDPLSGELPKAEIAFELQNLNGEYDAENPEGLVRYLMSRQRVTARYGYKLDGHMEWVRCGVFYLYDWATAKGISAKFRARDALEYMTDPYAGPNSGTLLAIAEAALTQADLPLLHDGRVPWVLDASLGGVQAADGADLSNYSIAEVLQLVANAGCCALYQDREGILHLAPTDDTEQDYRIDRQNLYQDAEVTLLKQLRAVDVNNGAYTLPVGDVGETQPVKNPLISVDRAPAVAAWIAENLQKRAVVAGKFRADPRLDALDVVRVEGKYTERPVMVTQIAYSYNGAFRGSFRGRGM